MQFSLLLTNLMNTKNITGYRLSVDTGISKQLISEWKNGKKLPGYENLNKLADYFDISIDYLVGRTDNPEINK